MVCCLFLNTVALHTHTHHTSRDVNVSHITAGYIVNSPKHGFVRVDKADDTGLASSLFNYANVSRDGLVDNTLTTYLPGADKPDIWRGYVNSNFPIFPEDILVAAGASFSGLVDRNLVGRVAAVSHFIPLPAEYLADRDTVELHVSRCNPGHGVRRQLQRASWVRLPFCGAAHSRHDPALQHQDINLCLLAWLSERIVRSDISSSNFSMKLHHFVPWSLATAIVLADRSESIWLSRIHVHKLGRGLQPPWSFVMTRLLQRLPP